MVIDARLSKVVVVCATAATVKTARIKIKVLKKDKIFIFLLEKLKTNKVFITQIL
jgi:transposase-like protein